MNDLQWLVLAGGLVILVLSVIASYYVVKLIQHRRQQRQQQQARLAEQRLQRERVVKSIKIIARGMLDEQLTLTEGAIRIRVLLDGLMVSQDVRESYAAFFHLSDATDHIPILQAWKKLSTREKLDFDRQREKLESDHREFVLDAAQRILVEELH